MSKLHVDFIEFSKLKHSITWMCDVMAHFQGNEGACIINAAEEVVNSV